MRFRPLLSALSLALLLSACSYLPDLGLEHPGVIWEEGRDSILIRPSSGSQASIGLIFIPGGLVDPHVYMEALSEVALEGPGYAVIIAKEPWNLAVLDADKALGLRGRVAGVDRWAIGGHSLGGVMACQVIDQDRGAFAGLLLEASYPAAADDLSTWGGTVLSLSAEFDALATRDKIAAGKSLLPAAAAYVEIAGGCHSYFGSYGPQAGDGSPTITRGAQHAAAAALIGSFLGGL